MIGPRRKVWRQRMRYSLVEPMYVRGEAGYGLAALAGALAYGLLALVLVALMFVIAPS